jgi:hypothetical protein
VKKKARAQVGIASFGFDYDETVGEEELLAKIDELNDRSDVHRLGGLVENSVFGPMYSAGMFRTFGPIRHVHCRKACHGNRPIESGRIVNIVLVIAPRCDCHNRAFQNTKY